MAVDVAASRAQARDLASPKHIAAAPARLVLPVIVLASFALRLLGALAQSVPVYFPDEYIYGTLARSIAESGRPLVRGSHAHFPALLEPILAAPFWLLGDPELAYRLTQAEHALAMSFAAVPAYLLARRLGISSLAALAVGGLAVASPDLIFSSFLLADPIAYPLALGALYAGVRVLESPTRRSQVAFVTLTALATFARVQYVVLPLAFLGAALVVEGRSVRRVATRFRVTAALIAAPLLAATALGTSRILGYYSGVVHEHLDAGALLHWGGIDALLLAYAAGWVLVPGAAIAIALALLRPIDRSERAFAALALFFGAGLLFEAALYASNGSQRFQERYLCSLIPLVAIGFALYVKRGCPSRKLLAVVGVTMLGLAASIPLSGYTIGGDKQDSPFLFAVFRLEKALGAGAGSLTVAAIASVLAVLAVASAFGGRRLRWAPVGAAVAVAVTVSAAAHSVQATNALAIRASHLPADARWVDHAQLGPVDVLQTAGAPADTVLEQLFWNRSLRSVALLGRARAVDAFENRHARVGPNGTLYLDGRPANRPLLVQNFASAITFADARRVGRGGTMELWRPGPGGLRLSSFTLGRYWDGWFANEGEVVLWPGRAGGVRGTLRLSMTLPANGVALSIRFHGKGVDRRVSFQPGEHRTVSFRVESRAAWAVVFKSSTHGLLWDGRAVSLRATPPIFTRS